MEKLKARKTQENRCPVYEFERKDGFSPTGEIVNLETFRKEEAIYAKFGRTSGFTDKGFVEDTVQELFLHFPSPLPPPGSKYRGSPFIHVQQLYCENCKKWYLDERASTEISKEDLSEISCTNCRKPLKP
jgi:uncharacterized protein YbaR (Trm112 family)